MDIQQQANIADEILHKLEIIDYYCILAGGAPRDWFHGREAADLDFYFYVPDASFLIAKMYRLGLIKTMYPFSIDPEYPATNDIWYVLTDTYAEQRVQYVLMRKPTFESVLPHFSLSICHVWYKNSKIRYTPWFTKTVEEKTIRQLKPAYSAGYVEKILARYPEYKYVETILE